MAATQSFDITTGCELQEVDNAVNQAMKEIRQRYDFKGLHVQIDFRRAENKLILRAPDEFKLRAMWDVVQEKMVRRQVPLKNLPGLGCCCHLAGPAGPHRAQPGLPGTHRHRDPGGGVFFLCAFLLALQRRGRWVSCVFAPGGAAQLRAAAPRERPGLCAAPAQ